MNCNTVLAKPVATKAKRGTLGRYKNSCPKEISGSRFSNVLREGSFLIWLGKLLMMVVQEYHGAFSRKVVL